jgi:CRISPR-associated protein Csb3
MNTIPIHLQENNLAEVLAGIAIAGIAEANTPRETSSRWEQDCLNVSTPLSEQELLDAIHEFLSDLAWEQSAGDVYQGCFSSSGKLGVAPFMNSATMRQTSVFKTFSGQVTPQKICDDLHGALEQVPRTSIENYLAHTAPGIGSWSLDWRSNGHSLDLGFSGNDDKTSDFDPVFVAVEVLSIAALAFFLPAAALSTANDQLTYHLWEQPVSGKLAGTALVGGLTTLPRRTYLVARRPKSYGKGASYKYFPNATPIH